MALSPAHRFGQLIGDILAEAVAPLLQDFAKQHALYLDKKGSRPTRGKGLKCSWTDLNGNRHDLDFVLERGGDSHKVGAPVAFIETAWRRYTKHSRNKAQEIQGAIVPLAQTYRNTGPFMGAILAGVFTTGALSQLKSLGFTILHFPYENVVAAFHRRGINAAFTESTPDAEVQRKVEACRRMSPKRRIALERDLLETNADDVNSFMKSLGAAVLRQIERIVILPLHGTARELISVDDAVEFIQGYYDSKCDGPVYRYEILIRYNNGDRIEAAFGDKEAAVKYLRTYQPIRSSSRRSRRC